MSTILSEYAQSYLRNNPQEWHAFISSLAEMLSESATIESVDFYNPNKYRLSSELIETIITESFMSPDIAYLVSGSENDIEAISVIKNILHENLNKFEVIEGRDYYGIIDIDSTGKKLVTKYDYDIKDEYEGYKPNLSTFRAYTLTYNEDIAKRITSLLINISGQKDATKSDLVRIDLIDIALYKALVSNPHLLSSINWRTFEKLLADILDTFGFNIELQKGTKDGGIDLIAVKKDSILGEHRYLLQAKRYKNKIGVEPVRQLLFLHSHHKATKACLACTASFTKGAWQLANQYKWQLELKDIIGVQEWVKDALRIKNIRI